MKALPIASALFLFMSSCVSVSAADFLNEARPLAEKFLRIKESRNWEPAPRSAWSFLFGTVSAEEEDLIKEIADLLKVNSLIDKHKEIDGLQQDIEQTKGEIANIQKMIASAPTPYSGALGYLQNKIMNTKESLGYENQEKERLIESKQIAIAEEKQELIGRMNRIGATLNGSDIDRLLSQVTADDFLELYGFYENLKNVFDGLSSVDLSKNNSEGGRLYYGVYLVMVETSIYMNNLFAQKIDREYLPKLKKYVEEADSLINSAKEDLATPLDADQKARLDGNLQANELTKRVGTTYIAILLETKLSILEQVRRLKSELNVAINTYRTARVSGQLRSLIKEADNTMSTLRKIVLPQPRIFDDSEMRREFDRLTDQMKGS